MGSATPVIVTVVAVVATVYAGPAIGAAIAESMGVAATATEAAALGAAAIGGSTSAVNAAVQGGNVDDVLKAGAIGAAAGGAGGAVGAQVPAGEPIARGVAGGAASGATGASLRGRDPVTGAIVGGVAGGVGAGIRGAFADPNIGDVEAQPGGFYGEAGVNEPLINPELQRFLTESAARTGSQLAGQFTARQLADTPPTRERPTREAGTTQGTGGPTSYQMGDVPTAGTPGSQALGQALRVGSTDVGGPGEPVESPGSGKTPERPVWNIASLRVKDETGGD